MGAVEAELLFESAAADIEDFAFADVGGIAVGCGDSFCLVARQRQLCRLAVCPAEAECKRFVAVRVDE